MQVVSTTGEMPAGLDIGHPATPKRAVAGVKDVAAARTSLEAAGIPSSLYHVVESRPGTVTKSLRDSFDPVPGGVEAHAAAQLGTIGFNVSHWDEGRTFVVTDHQTWNFAQNDGTEFRQPDNGRLIGNEVYSEPVFQGGSCPTTNCRYSDAALVKYDSEDAYQLGKVARPDQDESITVVGRYVIDDEERSIACGTPLIWVGKTTGQESGEVHTTCFNADYNDFNPDAPAGTTLLCQFEASPDSEAGDSGAPVLMPVAGDTVKLAGMVWGGDHCDDLCTDRDAVFSPIEGIRKEINPDTSVFVCDGLETRAGGGCDTDGGGSGGGGGDDCGPYAIQEC